jgi:hypothetical protein
MDHIDITVDQDQVYRRVSEAAEGAASARELPSKATRLAIALYSPDRLKRAGKEMRLIVDDGSKPATSDTGLIRLLVRANSIRNQLLADRSRTFDDWPKLRASFVLCDTAVLCRLLTSRDPQRTTLRE